MPSRRVWCALVAAAVALAATVSDVGTALGRVDTLVRQHRYQEVLDLLGPYAGADLDRDAAAAVAAELGRASYHLGRYNDAYRHLARAMTLRPDQLEAGLYFEAAAFLTGHRDEAFRAYEEVLRSGAHDLYLAITLPGERAFLAEPTVWRLGERYRQPLPVDLRRGAVMGVRLGEPRATVVAVLGAGEAGSRGALVARAGPELVWAFVFDDAGHLAEITVDAAHLLYYTPYRLQLEGGLDWKLTPEQARASLGAPAATTPSSDGGTVLGWRWPGVLASLEFAPPAPVPPPGWGANRPLLRLVRLALPATPAAG